MTTNICPECDKKCSSQKKLDTHILLNHAEVAYAEVDEFKAEEHDTGHIESRDEKGEQFGYE